MQCSSGVAEKLEWRHWQPSCLSENRAKIKKSRVERIALIALSESLDPALPKVIHNL